MKGDYARATKRVDGRLAVTCWCERMVLHVPRALVLAGLTTSCGAPDCQAELSA